MSKRQSAAETLVSQFFVAGLVFSDYADAKLKRGMQVTLIRDPNNVHDSNAIKVHVADRTATFLGWVPRDQTHEILGFKGDVSTAFIYAFEPANATHRRVLVNVYGVEADPLQANVIC